jgi:hypothetical protein
MENHLAVNGDNSRGTTNACMLKSLDVPRTPSRSKEKLVRAGMLRPIDVVKGYADHMWHGGRKTKSDCRPQAEVSNTSTETRYPLVGEEMAQQILTNQNYAF